MLQWYNFKLLQCCNVTMLQCQNVTMCNKCIWEKHLEEAFRRCLHCWNYCLTLFCTEEQSLKQLFNFVDFYIEGLMNHPPSLLRNKHQHTLSKTMVLRLSLGFKSLRPPTQSISISLNFWDKSEESQFQSQFDTIYQKSQSHKITIGLANPYFFQQLIYDLQTHKFLISLEYNKFDPILAFNLS